MNNTESLKLMLKSLHLSSFQEHYRSFARQAESEEFSFEQYLKTLVEQEVQDRAERRIARLLKRACLPEGKSPKKRDTRINACEIEEKGHTNKRLRDSREL